MIRGQWSGHLWSTAPSLSASARTSCSSCFFSCYCWSGHHHRCLLLAPPGSSTLAAAQPNIYRVFSAAPSAAEHQQFSANAWRLAGQMGGNEARNSQVFHLGAAITNPGRYNDMQGQTDSISPRCIPLALQCNFLYNFFTPLISKHLILCVPSVKERSGTEPNLPMKNNPL